MSTVRLLKDCKRGKAGAVVTAVPFHEANDLVRDGFAERPGVKPPAPAPAAGPTPHERAAARVKELEAELETSKAHARDLEHQTRELGEKLVAATDTIAALKAPPKK